MNFQPKKDLTGEKFGKLTVLSLNGFYTNPFDMGRSSNWLCKCECGNQKVINISALKLNRTISCGCHQKEQVAKKTRKGIKEASFYRLYSEYKNSAKRRNIKFELSKEQFKILTQKNCNYCGIQPTTKHIDKSCGKQWQEISSFIYNGIDRVDNKDGYNLENCVPCCKNCNFSKRTQTIEEFKEWIFRASDFLRNKIL